jgi:outer membrane murein-binding lipoprotein Lpp
VIQVSKDKPISDITGQDRTTEELLATVQTLHGGPGGPYSDDMEARVAKLEAEIALVARDTSAMRPDLASARERLAAIEVKVDHLPGKGFMVTALLLTLTVISALIAYFSYIIAAFGSG